MLGQSEAKRPEFWTKLATKMGDTQFGKFARHVLGKLDSMMAKFLAAEKIQRDAFTTDLPLVQNALAEAYAQQLKRRGLSKDADRALAKFLNEDRVQYAQRAYHGTPHRGIKQFTTEKMGTGEGAQVYGWGLYFAGDEEIGEFYRKKLTGQSKGKIEFNGKTFYGSSRREMMDFAIEVQDVAGLSDNARDFLAALAMKHRGVVLDMSDDIGARMTVSEGEPDPAQHIVEVYDWLSGLDEQLNPPEGGQVYEVDIPDDTDLLDRDAKLRDQSPAVRDAVVGLLGGERLQWKRERTEDGERLTSGQMRIEVRGMGAELFDGKTKVGGYPTAAAAQAAAQKRADPAAMSGADAYNALSKKLGGDKAASLALADAGVRGLKYRDANSRGPDGGKSNYVIFRDEDVAIAGVRYSQAARGAAQLDLFPGELATKRSTVETNMVIDSKGTRARGGNVNSKGQQITATKQGLKRFWDWFEGSEATDGKGRPLVLYHSTNGDISQFETNRESTNSYGILGEMTVRRAGIFMTPDDKFSQEYLRDGAGQNVMQVYAALKRPLDLRTGLKASDEQELESAGISTRLVRNAQNYWELFDSDDSGKNEFVDGLKAAGYDGAIFMEDSPGGDSSGGETYVAFDATQIKSATGNIGTFDPANPDIRYSQAAGDALTMPDPDITRLAGKSITLDVDTGAGQATMTMPADRAVRDIQDRMAAAKKLVECLK